MERVAAADGAFLRPGGGRGEGGEDGEERGGQDHRRGEEPWGGGVRGERSAGYVHGSSRRGSATALSRRADRPVQKSRSALWAVRAAQACCSGRGDPWRGG
ncbi:hypothetical protein GCM10009802_46730 [Streptomyces synnematoformans]|uniref:Uncharacterized protein n=1 Tax=Streptomyces synnematoformans TaxID=415721 RepID=A0ABN2Z6P9_9ACTN